LHRSRIAKENIVRIFILGGTVFLGRHLVEAAVAAGHDVALFNRGQHNPELFPNVEKLRGDRDGDVGALAGRRFDAVIDTSAYTVAQVTSILDALDGRFMTVTSEMPGMPEMKTIEPDYRLILVVHAR
jgi:nucleoside-diphosphate-sugar epimerase